MKAETGPLKDHYMGLNSADQKDYKKRWAAKQFDDFKEAKVFKQSWQRVDTTKGITSTSLLWWSSWGAGNQLRLSRER